MAETMSGADQVKAIFSHNLEKVREANRLLASTQKDALISFSRHDTALATLREWESQLEKLLSHWDERTT